MLISIVTATFNSEATLRDTFESLLKQSFSDYEYIVKDGGSKDGTLQIIKEYEPRFNGRMKWVSCPDKGLYDAINEGIRMASGEIVGIINSDDFFHRNDILQIVADAFADKQVQAVYGDVRFVRPDDLEKTVRYYSSARFTPARFRYGFMPAHPTFYTYKSNFENYGYYKLGYKIAADYELLIRFLYTHRIPVKYLPVDFMKMRTGGVSTSGLKSTVTLNREIVRACKENGLWTCVPLLYLKYFVKVKELLIKHNS